MGAETKQTEESQVDEVKRIPIADWLAEGKRLFGDDAAVWRFVCSNCKHVQTIADFIELRDLKIWDGNDAQIAYYSCIGRYDTRIPEAKKGQLLGNPKSPCDYTLGGLIGLAKTIVIDDDDREHHVFEFDRSEEGANE